MRMNLSKLSIGAALAIALAAPASAIDLGGSNGISVGKSSNGALGLGVSVGGKNGVNADVGADLGGSSAASVGADVSVGGARGLTATSDTTVGGASGVVDSSTDASIGGRNGLNASADVNVGGRRGLADVNADVSVGRTIGASAAANVGRTGAGIGIGVGIGTPGGTVGPSAPGSRAPTAGIPANPAKPRASQPAPNLAADMSNTSRIRVKNRCRDIVANASSYDSTLVELCLAAGK